MLLQNDGSVVVGITGDNRGLEDVLAQTDKALAAAGKKWEGTVGSAADGMSSRFANAFTKIATGAAMAKVGAELGKLAAEAINLASDLEEVQNVIDVTFGDDAGTVDKWAKNAKKQFGLTETQAKRFTSTLGAMFKSAGLAGSEITSMSTDLAGLAADMASFYNLDFDTAFQKIQSGIAGQTEPLRALGISLTESNLSAFAAENGQVYKDLTEAEKIVLRYKYIMQATTDAQGDFERTSDGYANAMRLLQTNLDQLKTNLGESLLPFVNSAVNALNSLFDAFLRTPETTLTDVFADIDADTERKMALIGETATHARDLVNVLDELNSTEVETPEGRTTYQDLFTKLSELRAAGGDVTGYLSGLGLSVEDVSRDYNVWLSLMGELTGTIPGLSSVINDQTGEIEGGTSAVNEYIDAWQQAQEQLAIGAAFERRGQALAAEKRALDDLKADMLIAQGVAKRLRSEADTYLLTHENLAGWESIDALNDAQTEAEELADSYAKKQAEYDQLMADYTAGLEEYNAQMAASATATGDAAEAMTTLQKAAAGDEAAIADITATVQALGDTLTQIADTYQSTWESATKDVDSAVKGFDKIVTPAQKAAQEVRDLKAQLTSDNEAEINLKISAKEGELVSYGSMMEGLQSQLDYLRTYQANLAAAREAGYDLDMLAELADGSTESADILEQLAKNTDINSVMEFNNAWADVQAAKSDLSTDLTDTRLSADDEYQALVQSAADMIAELDMYDGAQSAAALTVEGIVQGLGAGLPGITSQVDAIIAQLERLTAFVPFSGPVGNWQLGAMLGTGGGLANRIDGSNANGLDYVPFDGYLSVLHEGESILTAEEARVWRNFVSGAVATQNIDYDALGGVMRDNIHAGGNVYLNAHQVGRVLDGVQADQYRSLQRSGWQG